MILVIGVGEAPRNYLAQLAIGAGIAAAGWLWLFEAAMRRWPTLTILAVGAFFGPILGMVFADAFGVRVRIGAIGGLVGGAARGGSGRRRASQRSRGIARGRGRPRARGGRPAGGQPDLRHRRAGRHHRLPPHRRDQGGGRRYGCAWARDNVEPGSTIAFGSYLGFEMGLALRDDFTLRQVRHVLAVADVDAPDGVTMFGRPATDDWVSIDIAPKNVNEFQAFSASMLIEQLRGTGADYWVYTTGTSTAAPTIIPALEGAEGFEQVAHWTFERPRGAPIETSVYKLDPDRLALDTTGSTWPPTRSSAWWRSSSARTPHHSRVASSPRSRSIHRATASEALMDRLRSIAAAAVDP